jgi:GNAT superfamily N-acetyltransferase
MAVYYASRNMDWDDAHFDRYWAVFENFEVFVDSVRQGVIRFSYDNNCCYIRDFQIEPDAQGKGVGVRCISFAVDHARQRQCHELRLKVYRENPAHRLYERCGFQLHREAP